jgi:hypothetical protein
LVRVLSLGLAALVFIPMGESSYNAMRFAVVGTNTQANELASLQPLLRGRRVIYLGSDDFIDWELPETHVASLWLGVGPAHTAPTLIEPVPRPEKPWAYGVPMDFDSIEPASYDRFEYVIAPRDGRLSEPPPNLVLVRQTREFNVFRRVGPTPHRLVLAEGQEPGAVLRCDTPAGRRIAATRGIAALREAPIAVPLPLLAPGSKLPISMTLPAGRWQLTMPYVSPQPMTLSARGKSFALPAALDRPGTGWPAGQVLLPRRSTVQFTIGVHGTALRGLNQPVYTNELVATRAQPDQIVPPSRACGKYVDWYLPR